MPFHIVVMPLMNGAPWHQLIYEYMNAGTSSPMIATTTSRGFLRDRMMTIGARSAGASIELSNRGIAPSAINAVKRWCSLGDGGMQ